MYGDLRVSQGFVILQVLHLELWKMLLFHLRRKAVRSLQEKGPHWFLRIHSAVLNHAAVLENSATIAQRYLATTCMSDRCWCHMHDADLSSMFSSDIKEMSATSHTTLCFEIQI